MRDDWVSWKERDGVIGAGRSCAVFSFWLDGGTFVCVIPRVVVVVCGAEAEERALFVLVTATSLLCALLRSSEFSLFVACSHC